MPKEKIRRIFKIYKVKPLKSKFRHTIQLGDTERKIKFSLRTRIIFRDQTTFMTNNVVFFKKLRHWCKGNPGWIINFL